MQRTLSRSSLVNLTLNQYSQSDTGRNSASTLFFVIPQGLTEDTCSPRLISAKRLCVDFNLYSEWLPEQVLLNKAPQNNNVYVLDPFNGTAYDYLHEHFVKNKKFMIIGPQCIKYAVQQPESHSPIQSKGYPFCNLAMQNICITLTGFTKEINAELTDLVQKMNGVVSKVYSAATTHVVAENTLTAKCMEAYKNDILVMTSSWIKAVWAECQDELIDATDVKFIKYHCPIFHNIEICVSQIPSKIKAALDSTIKANGGSYSKDFKKNVADILVTPFASGEKYKFAQQWGITCVTPEWIDKSKQAGHVLPFDKFHPQRLPTEELCSTQLENKKGVPLPDCSNMTALSDINEGSSTKNKRELVNETYLTDMTSVSAVQQHQNVRDTTLDFLRKAPTGFLDGCTIYLCGHDSGDDNIGEIRKILNSSGATRSDRISERVSHVLIIHSRISEQEAQTIKALDSVPSVVSLEWLIESAKQGSLADEERFAFELPFSKKNDAKVKEKAKPQTSNFRAVTPVEPKTKVSLPLRQEKTGHLTTPRLDSQSDIETPIPKQPVRAVKGSIMVRAISFSADESPLLREGMSKSGSKQLKRALAFACEETPETLSSKRRCSTPHQKVVSDFVEAQATRAAQARTAQAEKRRKVQEDPNNIESSTVSTLNKDNIHVDNEDDGISMDVPSKPCDDTSHSSHETDLEKRSKIEAEQFSATTNKVNDRNTTSAGYSSSKSSAASSTQSRKSSPPRRPINVSSQVSSSAKFGVLHELDVTGGHDLGDPSVNWTDKIKANAEGFQHLEITQDKSQEEPSKCIVVDDEPEIIQIDSPPQPERRQTRQTKKESQSSTKSSIIGKRRDEKTSKKQEKKKSSRPNVFILSGFSGAEKTASIGTIEEVGGIVSAVDFYDKTADAVIAFKVTRSEKILGAIAGGLPILHPKYLTACQKAKKILEFEDFIWKEVEASNPSEKNMTRFAKYWYDKIQMDPSNMPYTKFRAYLSEPKEHKKNAYKRLIEAGGGKVSTCLDDVNIIIGDTKEAKALQGNAVCKPPMFLNDVILSDEDVSWLT